MPCRSNAQLVINSAKDCSTITLSHPALTGMCVCVCVMIAAKCCL